jgi:TRAP-type uncharacterized transport system fused permease subunit
LTAATGIAALASGFQGWLPRRTSTFEQAMLVAAGLALVYPRPLFDAVGIALFVVVLVLQYLRRRLPRACRPEPVDHARGRLSRSRR